MSPQVWIAVIVGVAASAQDLLRRRISNWIPAAALAAGLGYHTLAGGGGVPSRLWRAPPVASPCFWFLLLGGMGGGDVKLMAGFGAIVGIERLLAAALWTAGIGGLMACAALGIRGWSDGEGDEPRGAAMNPAAEQGQVDPVCAGHRHAGALLSLVPKIPAAGRRVYDGP